MAGRTAPSLPAKRAKGWQTVSYTQLDVYKRQVPAQKDFIAFAAYVTLFPQLIAGPIVRYADVAVMLVGRKTNVEQIAEGIRRFIIGFGKKVLLANQVYVIWNEDVYKRQLLASHIRTCVARDIREGHDEVIDELVATLQKLMK